ncbi:hypothetical protein M569_07238 [Genlisea aurea]|uniref:Uncharacterized protein n=1 Tax=Genlisea aurea TaxID=192259 RepID=S8CRP8_9LAMI|nr:hypothetical protein M569_07238 [Genlisea aurea]
MTLRRNSCRRCEILDTKVDILLRSVMELRDACSQRAAGSNAGLDHQSLNEQAKLKIRALEEANDDLMKKLSETNSRIAEFRSRLKGTEIG